MEQKKLNVPSVSVGIVTVTTSPAATVRLIPSSGMAKPWVPATPVSRISRTSPFFAVTAEGENAQLSADISIVRFAEGEEVELAELSELSVDEELLLVLSSEDAVELSSEELVVLSSDELTDSDVAEELLDANVETEVAADDTDETEVEEEESSKSTPACISHAARTRTSEKNPMERMFFIGMDRGK